MATWTKVVVLRIILISSIVVLSACSSVSPPSQSFGASTPAVSSSAPLTVVARYQPAPTLSVLVVPDFVAGREGELVALAKAECAGKSFCSVGFWANDGNAPRRVKMSDGQMNGRIVQFAINARTGLNKTTWNCRLATKVIGDCA